MKPLRIRSLFLSLLLSLGAAACGPSIDPAAKADVDRRISLLQPQQNAFPAQPSFMPRPMAVGQWTQMKIVGDKGEPSLSTYKIVGQDADAHWIEVVNETYMGKTVIKMLIAFGDRSNPSTVDIRMVRMKDKNGQVTDFQGPLLSLMRSSWQNTINTLTVSWQGLAQEDATVIAGTFNGCYKARTDASFGPFRSASISWSHPAVPINGLVKSQGVDNPHTMELVAFGETGAVSEIP